MRSRILMSCAAGFLFALWIPPASVSYAGVSICGNGLVEPGEACDDGNTVAGDGCESDCTETTQLCGDGLVHSTEECDDGNTVAGDGCEV